MSKHYSVEVAANAPADEEEPKEAGPRFLFYNSISVFMAPGFCFITVFLFL